jgi:hypothetical protein
MPRPRRVEDAGWRVLRSAITGDLGTAAALDELQRVATEVLVGEDGLMRENESP